MRKRWVIGVTVHLPVLCCAHDFNNVEIRIGNIRATETGKKFQENSLCIKYTRGANGLVSTL